MNMPFSEYQPGVLADGERACVRPRSEGHHPVCRDQARTIGICSGDELPCTLFSPDLSEEGQIISVHGCKSQTLWKSCEGLAGGSCIEEPVVIADDRKQMADQFDRPPFPARCLSIPAHGGSDALDRSDSGVVRGKDDPRLDRRLPCRIDHSYRLPHNAGGKTVAKRPCRRADHAGCVAKGRVRGSRRPLPRPVGQIPRLRG